MSFYGEEGKILTIVNTTVVLMKNLNREKKKKYTSLWDEENELKKNKYVN